MATAKKNTTRTASQLAAEALTEARALLSRREAEHEQAEETRAELISRLNRGDDQVTALDLATAHYAIERAALLMKAAERAIPGAERELDKASAIDNPSLARFIAERIEADAFAFGLYGVRVLVTHEKPNGPGVYLSQPSATRVQPDTGLMSGRVNLTVITPNRARIDGAAILAGLAAIEREGVALVQGHASPSPDGCSVLVDIKNLKPELPTLPEQVNQRHVEDLARNLAMSISAKGGQVTHESGNGLYDVTVNRINWSLGECSMADQVRDGDQVQRTILAEFDLSSRFHRGDTLAGYTEAAVASLAGEFAAGIGRIKAARIVSRKANISQPVPGHEFRHVPLASLRVAVEVEAVARIAG